MKDDELIRAYTIGILIITFLEEYSKLERMGVLAKVYNSILKKNTVFQNQINELKLKERKKISHKAQLFLLAQQCSISAWTSGVEKSTKNTISVGTTVANLFRLNEEYITKIYKLSEADFIKINQQSQAGVTLHSCKMARILTEDTLSVIDKYFAKG